MIGGKSFQRDCDVLSVECYNTKKRKSREMFTLPSCDNYVNCDCVTLKVPITNKDINFNDVLLFDKWIMWWFFEREKKHFREREKTQMNVFLRWLLKNKKMKNCTCIWIFFVCWNLITRSYSFLSSVLNGSQKTDGRFDLLIHSRLVHRYMFMRFNISCCIYKWTQNRWKYMESPRLIFPEA